MTGCGHSAKDYYGPTKRFGDEPVGYTDYRVSDSGPQQTFSLSTFAPTNPRAYLMFARRARELCNGNDYRLFDDAQKTKPLGEPGLGILMGYVECLPTRTATTPIAETRSTPRASRETPPDRTAERGSCYSNCQQDVNQCRGRGLRPDTCLGLFNSCRALCDLDGGTSSSGASPQTQPPVAVRPTPQAPSPTRPTVSSDRLYHPFNTCYRTEPQAVPPNCTTCERIRVCNICSEPLELSARQFRDGRWGGIMATVQPGQCRGAHYWPGATAHQLHFCRRNDGFDWDRGMCRP